MVIAKLLKVMSRNFEAPKLVLVLWSLNYFWWERGSLRVDVVQPLDYLSCLSLDLSYEIPHSCLKYGKGVTGWNKYLFKLHLWSGGTWNSLGWIFHKLIRVIFLLYSMIIYTFYYVALLVILSWLILWLYVGYMHGSITWSTYGSCYALIT